MVASINQVQTILSTLNEPPLVATAGFVASTCLPVLAAHSNALPFLTVRNVKLINFLLFMLNLVATSQPNRLDGIQQQLLLQTQNQQQNDDAKEKPNLVGERTTTSKLMDIISKRDRSLFNPSGWAFIIWAPIFLGEFIFTITSALFISETGSVATAAAVTTRTLSTILKRTSIGFSFGQIFQTLWAASFRPKYFVSSTTANKQENIRWKPSFISAAMLTGIAVSLSYANAAYTNGSLMISKSSSAPYSFGQYLLYFLPISLHFGWTSAAALVNINGNIAGLTDNKYIVAWTGHVSVLIAVLVGVTVTVSRSAPVYGSVISWALLACSTGLNNRIEKIKTMSVVGEGNKNRKSGSLTDGPGYYGATTQQLLCRIGSIVSGTVSLVVAIMMRKMEKI